MYIGVAIDTVQNMCGNAEVYMAYLNYLLINKELITVSSKSALFHKFALSLQKVLLPKPTTSQNTDLSKNQDSWNAGPGTIQIQKEMMTMAMDLI